MIKEPKWKLRFQNYEKAYLKFSSIIQKRDKDEFMQMAMIKSFEYTFELG